MSKAIRHVAPIRQYKKTPPYEIIIPAAGLGNRMKSYGAKSLIQIQPQCTILQYQLKMIQAHLRCSPQTILVVGFEANKVMNNTPQDIIKIENENYETTNVARSIGMGLRAAKTDYVIVIYGDLIFNEYALKFSIEDESLLVVDTNGSMSENEIGCRIVNNAIEHMHYDLSDKWAQIMLLTGRELTLAKSLCWNPANYNKFGFEIINDIIGRGGHFRAVRPNKLQVNDIDSTKDLATITHIL